MRVVSKLINRFLFENAPLLLPHQERRFGGVVLDSRVLFLELNVTTDDDALKKPTETSNIFRAFSSAHFLIESSILYSTLIKQSYFTVGTGTVPFQPYHRTIPRTVLIHKFVLPRVSVSYKYVERGHHGTKVHNTSTVLVYYVFRSSYLVTSNYQPRKQLLANTTRTVSCKCTCNKVANISELSK
jgi:hypothetical protein